MVTRARANRLLDRVLDSSPPAAVPAGYRLGQKVEYIDAAAGEAAPMRRTGTVWSHGPRDASMWVMPDHDPAAPVTVTVARRAGRRELIRRPGDAEVVR